MSVIKENTDMCPSCGKNVHACVPTHHLLPGTVLNGSILIGAALGEGGFGITYVARDLNLDIKVAVKEYYPSGYVNRSNTVSPDVTFSVSEAGKDFFVKGKERFLREARILAKLSAEPGVVEVKSFFEQNNTAYIVMEYIEGQDLKQYLREKGTISQEETIELLMPIMTALTKIHEQGLIHRDISPDNIRIGKNGIKLIDFGAAKDYFDSANKSVSVFLKPGYAPEEQYRRKGLQGPWTDVYALCATIYTCVTGVTPDDATDRLLNDELKSPSARGVDVKRRFETVLMKGLSVHQKDRYHSVDEFLHDLRSDNRHPKKQKTASKRRSVMAAVIIAFVAISLTVGLVIAYRVLIPERRYNEAISLMDEGKYDEAISLFEELDGYKESQDKIDECKYLKDASERRKALVSEVSKANVSDTILLGSYEQDNDLDNGKEPIEWIVLDKGADKALVMSMHALEVMAYGESRDGVASAWENSNARIWLNSDFYSDAFDDSEKSLVLTEKVSGENTEDRLFLLSVDEVNSLLPDKEQRICRATDHVAQTCFDGTLGAGKNVWWWLRTGGKLADHTAYVGNKGVVSEYGDLITTATTAVRPAMWITIE